MLYHSVTAREVDQMAPTVRIDDEVYNWLQEQARPFEDTPNSVLRRVAGLDQSADVPAEKTDQSEGKKDARIGTPGNPLPLNTKRSPFRRPRLLNGRQLNQEWKVGAQHALFHRDGCWYNNLEHFPGALFDPDGYILFGSEKEYKACSYLNIGKQTNVNVTPGISAIPGYVRKT